MKTVLLLFFIFIAFTAQSQEKTDSLANPIDSKSDSINQAIKSRIDSLNLPTNRLGIDSLKNSSIKKLKSIENTFQTRIDSLNQPTKKLSRLDSLKQNVESNGNSLKRKIDQPFNKLNDLQTKAQNTPKHLLTIKLDSLKKTDSELLNLDSAQMATKAKIDSLKSLQLPHDKYTLKLDSLQSTYTEKVNSKIASLEKTANEKISKVKDKITGKLDVAQDINIDTPEIPKVGGVKIPDKDIDLNLPDTDANLNLPDKSDLSLPNTDLGIDQPDLNTDLNLDINIDLKDKLDTDAVESLKEKANIDEYTDKLDKAKDVPKDKMDKVKEIDEIQEVTEKLGKAKEIGGEIEGYQEELEKVKEGDFESLEKKAEEQAGNLKAIQELQSQRAEFDKMKGDHEGFKKEMEQYQDTAFVKQMVKEKVSEMVVEHFAEQQGVLKSAQTKLLMYKGKYKSLPSIKDIPKRKPNPYKGKSLKERIAPGSQIEVQRANNYTGIDLAPFVGYKINDRLSVYGGYLYRITFNNDEKSFVFDEPSSVYGPRVFANYKVYKGFFATLAFDRLRTHVPRLATGSETTSAWINGGFVGVGKQYKFAKKVNGSIQGLFNFLHDANSPYQKKFNVRMGFELEWKKKAKSRRKPALKSIGK